MFFFLLRKNPAKKKFNCRNIWTPDLWLPNKMPLDKSRHSFSQCRENFTLVQIPTKINWPCVSLYYTGVFAIVEFSKFDFTIITRKAKFIVGFTNFKPGASKQPQQESGKSQILQKVNNKISWLCGCSERKSLSEDVPKNVVFYVYCRIKLINFSPRHVVWPFCRDMFAF